jgi:hypothetical protein
MTPGRSDSQADSASSILVIRSTVEILAEAPSASLADPDDVEDADQLSGLIYVEPQ